MSMGRTPAARHKLAYVCVSAWNLSSRRQHRLKSVVPQQASWPRELFIGGGLPAFCRTRAARHPERHAVFVGSGDRAGAFDVEAAYPPGSPPTVNGTTPATPVNSSAATSPSRRYCAPTEGPAARPDRWAKAPRRIRLGLTLFGPARRSPQAPASGPCLLFGSGNLVGAGRRMVVIDVGMGSTRAGRF